MDEIFLVFRDFQYVVGILGALLSRSKPRDK